MSEPLTFIEWLCIAISCGSVCVILKEWLDDRRAWRKELDEIRRKYKTE